MLLDQFLDIRLRNLIFQVQQFDQDKKFFCYNKKRTKKTWGDRTLYKQIHKNRIFGNSRICHFGIGVRQGGSIVSIIIEKRVYEIFRVDPDLLCLKV